MPQIAWVAHPQKHTKRGCGGWSRQAASRSVGCSSSANCSATGIDKRPCRNLPRYSSPSKATRGVAVSFRRGGGLLISATASSGPDDVTDNESINVDVYPHPRPDQSCRDWLRSRRDFWVSDVQAP